MKRPPFPFRFPRLPLLCFITLSILCFGFLPVQAGSNGWTGPGNITNADLPPGVMMRTGGIWDNVPWSPIGGSNRGVVIWTGYGGLFYPDLQPAGWLVINLKYGLESSGFNIPGVPWSDWHGIGTYRRMQGAPGFEVYQPTYSIMGANVGTGRCGRPAR